MDGHADSWQEWIAGMLDPNTVDCFPKENLAHFLPTRDGKPRWEKRRGSDDLKRRSGTACHVNHPLMDENSLKRIDVVGIETRKGQDSQAPSIELTFFRLNETSTH